MPKWLSAVLHILAIGAGAYVSYAHGTPVPLVVTSAVNALLPSPASKETK